MGWSHPDISLEDLLVLVKGFIDILILANGYQSSVSPAHWDAENIKKAINWGLFFENVLRRLPDSDAYQDSVKELDAALFELTSDPCFPQGLSHLSSATLSRAREFVIGQLLQALPLRDAHLIALLTAVIEIDLDDISHKTKYNPINLYIDRLTLLEKSLNVVPRNKGFAEESETADVVPANQALHELRNCDGLRNGCGENLRLVIQEVLKRHIAVSCISSVEPGLNILSEIITKNNQVGTTINVCGEQRCDCKSLDFARNEENFTIFTLWNQWRSKNLSYLLDKRTISLVSGASLIFRAPKVQWLKVFDSFEVSTKAHKDNFHEIIELSLLGSVSDRWNRLIEHFMSVSNDSVPISMQYYHVRGLLQEKYPFLHSNGKTIKSKENDILDYLSTLLDNQPCLLWRLPPVLAGVAIPPWSTLFNSYMAEIDRQINGDYSRIRCCSCSQHGKEHKDCEIAERIWCLYVFHVRGCDLMADSPGT